MTKLGQPLWHLDPKLGRPLWHPDPWGHHKWRWWNGTQWTTWVDDPGKESPYNEAVPTDAPKEGATKTQLRPPEALPPSPQSVTSEKQHNAYLGLLDRPLHTDWLSYLVLLVLVTTALGSGQHNADSSGWSLTEFLVGAPINLLFWVGVPGGIRLIVRRQRVHQPSDGITPTLPPPQSQTVSHVSGIDSIAEEAALWQLLAIGAPNAQPEGAVQLGDMLLRRGDLEGAKGLYQRAIDSGHPDYAPTALVNLAVLLSQQGDLEGAMAACLHVVDGGHPEQARRAAQVLEELQGRAAGYAAATPPTQVTNIPTWGTAGWVADPLGHSKFRYWDGTAWTSQVSN